MAQLAPLSVRQYIVILNANLKTQWNKCTGGKQSRDTQEYNDGQTGQTKNLLGFIKNEMLTLSKPFDAVQDKALLNWVNDQMAKDVSNNRFTVTVQPVQVDLKGTVISGAGTFQFTNCQLVSWTKPEADRDGSSVSTLELEIDWEAWTYQ